MAKSIVARLTLAYALVTAVVFALLGLVTHLGLSAVLSRQLDNGLLATARAEAAYATDHADEGIHLHENPEIARASGLHHHVQITDLQGRILVASHDLHDEPLPLDPAALAANAGGIHAFRSIRFMALPHRVLYFPLRHGGRSLSLQVAVSREYLSLVEGQLLLVFAALSLLALAAAVAAGYVVARRALAPVRRITATAAAIGETTLGERIPPAPAADEVGRLTEVLNRMLARLDQAFTSQKRFVGDAAHELRSPLAILKSNAEFALRRDRSPAEHTELWQSSIEEVDRLTRLTNDLLLIAQGDAGVPTGQRQPVAVDTLVATAVERHRPTAEREGIGLVLALQADGARVAADRDQLTRVLDNLLGNALRYTPAGKGIQVRTKADGTAVELIVADEGIGIQPADQAHVFDRFYRADEARARASGGTGLGLSISRMIVEQHGGTITLSSRPGEGSTFTVTLPRVPPSA